MGMPRCCPLADNAITILAYREFIERDPSDTLVVETMTANLRTDITRQQNTSGHAITLPAGAMLEAARIAGFFSMEECFG